MDFCFKTICFRIKKEKKLNVKPKLTFQRFWTNGLIWNYSALFSVQGTAFHSFCKAQDYFFFYGIDNPVFYHLLQSEDIKALQAWIVHWAEYDPLCFFTNTGS